MVGLKRLLLTVDPERVHRRPSAGWMRHLETNPHTPKPFTQLLTPNKLLAKIEFIVARVTVERSLRDKSPRSCHSHNYNSVVISAHELLPLMTYLG